MSHEFSEDKCQNIQNRIDTAIKVERERILKEIEDLLETTFNECPLGKHINHWEIEKIVNNRSDG